MTLIITRMPQKKKKVPTNARQKKEATINACIDLTATSSIAGQALDALSSQDKLVVKEKISKTLKKAINKNVKDVVLDVPHKECLDQMNMAHLTRSVVPGMEEMAFSSPAIESLATRCL
jgi:hypothetical protein